MTYTHKGWFGICPVYFSRPESDAPGIDPRHWAFIPLMLTSELLFGLWFTFRGLVSDNYEPQWPMVITGELATPIRRGAA